MKWGKVAILPHLDANTWVKKNTHKKGKIYQEAACRGNYKGKGV